MTELMSLQVEIADMDTQFIQFGTDESYEFIVSGSSAVLTSQTVFGAMRGIEVFSATLKGGEG